MATSHTPNQLADQIRDYLAGWLVRDFPSYIFTVEAVTFSANRQQAYVWCHTYMPATASLREELGKRTPYYRHKLAQAITRRTIPNLEILIG